MPGTRCTVGVCNNSYDRTKRAGLKILYHHFPKAQPVRNIWIERCGRAGKWNPDSCHICSVHFTTDDYLHDPGKRRLRPTAVPSLFLTETPPINIKLLTPRKKRKLSLNDKTPTYSNEDNIMPAQEDVSSYTDTASNHSPTYELFLSEDSETDCPFYIAVSENDNLAGIDLENLQCYHSGKYKRNDQLGIQEESSYSSKKPCIIMKSTATETKPDHLIKNYKSLVDENEKLRSELIELNSKHQKLLLNMKFLESKIESLRLSKLIQEL